MPGKDKEDFVCQRTVYAKTIKEENIYFDYCRQNDLGKARICASTAGIVAASHLQGPCFSPELGLLSVFIWVSSGFLPLSKNKRLSKLALPDSRYESVK